jgi:hypothetical protein
MGFKSVTIYGSEEENNDCPHDFAKQFKEAIERNDGNKAADLLLPWPSDDANRKYAFIIFDGTPPSNVSHSELMGWLDTADSMKACDPSLKPLFRNVALQVIDMHK